MLTFVSEFVLVNVECREFNSIFVDDDIVRYVIIRDILPLKLWYDFILGTSFQNKYRGFVFSDRVSFHNFSHNQPSSIAILECLVIVRKNLVTSIYINPFFSLPSSYLNRNFVRFSFVLLLLILLHVNVFFTIKIEAKCGK